MSKNQIITNEWVYIYNYANNQMFAASSDKKDDDHLVETGSGGRTDDKYQWMIHEYQGDYFIQNRVRGFMFAASGDKKGSDHLVECRPTIASLKSAVHANEESNKWSWRMAETDLGLLFINNQHGQMFAANSDKIGDDHLVETNPDSVSESGSKYLWRLELI